MIVVALARLRFTVNKDDKHTVGYAELAAAIASRRTNSVNDWDGDIRFAAAPTLLAAVDLIRKQIQRMLRARFSMLPLDIYNDFSFTVACENGIRWENNEYKNGEALEQFIFWRPQYESSEWHSVADPKKPDGDFEPYDPAACAS